MIGTVIKNRYKLLTSIGGGGMAEVYKASDLILNREVAVKILRQQYVNDTEFVKRFRREAHSVASLSHENLVAIYDVGEEKDVYFIVMEYIEGSTLKEQIQRRGSLPVEEALDIATKIADALEHAHQHNIVHRDIKPHNILIGKHGEVKVTDFGIARAISQATITHTGSVLGSVHYISPEQAKGGYTSEKSDLYSLGVVLYEMVTGSLPFSGESPISVVLKHLQENFIYPREIDSSIPQSVENIIIKALMKNPDKRYASANEMVKDLETALDLDRIDEPRLEIENDFFDDEKTMVIPAMLNENDSNSYVNQSRKNKKSDFDGKLKVGLIAILILAVSLVGFQSIKNMLVIPTVELPVLEGKQLDEAIEELNDLNLNYKVVEKTDPVVKTGHVIKQEPYQGNVIKTTQEVTLYVSLGKKKVAIPDVINMSQGQGMFLLEQQKFTNIKVIPTYDENTPSGIIFKQEPEANLEVIPDEEQISLFVSKGKEKFEMPNLIGLSEVEAKAILTTNGLVVGNIEYEYTYDQPQDKVYKQFPYEPGREVTNGDKVDLYISKGNPVEAKVIYSDILVLLYDNEEAEISIVINDAREKDIVLKKEVINETTFYEVELLLTPNTEGTIKVYKDGTLYQTKKVEYY